MSKVFQRKPQASLEPLGWDQFQEMVNTASGMYPLFNQTLLGDRESMEGSFCGLSRGALKGSAVVYACIHARAAVFSQVRFQFRQRGSNGSSDFFGTEALRPLERPWPNGTTADLLARAELDVSMGGNSYTARRGGRLARLRPDWVDIMVGSNTNPDEPGYAIDAEIVGFVYWPGGRGSGEEPELLLPEEVAHYAPMPDPEARFRGMSWLTPVIREVIADKATTQHKLKFFENGATPNMKVQMDISDPEKFQKWVDLFNERHRGVGNHFKTLFLAAGMDAEVIGSNLNQIDFTKVQGGGEVRVAAAAGVPASIIGLAKSLEGAALNNEAKDSARRTFGDITLANLWQNFTGSIAHLIDVPGGAELAHDPRGVAFLKDDIKDAAEAMQMQMATINTGVMAGFDPDAIVAAVAAGDIGLLKGKHSGLMSVQLLPPGTDLGGNDDSAGSSGSGNGNGNGNGTSSALALYEPPRPPDIHLDSAAPVSNFNFHEGALQLTLPAIEAPPAPNVTVEQPDHELRAAVEAMKDHTEPRPRKAVVERDENGVLVGVNYEYEEDDE